MRITVDLDPSELKAATEFLQALRSLAGASEVSVRQEAARPAAQAPPARSTSITPAPGQAARPDAATGPPAGFPPAPQQGPSRQSRPPANGVPTNMEDLRSQLTALAGRLPLSDPATNSQITAGLVRLLELAGAQMDASDVTEALYLALAQHLFDNETMREGLNRMPFLNVLAAVPEATRNPVFSMLTKGALGELTKSRPVTVDRQDFLAEAEVFGGLISAGYIHVEGAIKTVVSMMEKDTMRCAALTMLGKTIEHAHQQLLEKCGDREMTELRHALGHVHDPEFDYDKDYVASFLGWEELRIPPSEDGYADGHAEQQHW